MLRTLTSNALFTLSLTLGLTLSAQAETPMTLNDRVQQAAEHVCSGLLSPRNSSLLYRKWYAECLTASTAKIMARVALDKQRTFASK